MLKRAREKGKKGTWETFILRRDLNENSLSRIFFPEDDFGSPALPHESPQETLKNLSSSSGEMILCNPSRLVHHRRTVGGGRSFLKRPGGKGPFLVGILTIFLAMGALNVMIQRRKKALYHCWNEEQMRELIGSCGLQIRWLKKSCLADSHLLIWAIKER
jgi:hypothetical protein